MKEWFTSTFTLCFLFSQTTESRDSELVPINRKCTDVFFLILIIAFIVILVSSWLVLVKMRYNMQCETFQIVMVAYCFAHGNIHRILNGYDDCGNICGVENEKDTKLGCKGSDKRNENYLLVERSNDPINPENPYIHRQCVERCEGIPNYKKFLNRCVLDKQGETSTQKFLSKTGLTSFFQDVSEDLATCWLEVLYVCMTSFVFSFIVLILFRFVVGFVVWIVLFASIVASLIATIFLWVKYAVYKKGEDSDREKTYLISAIVFTIVTVIIVLLIIAMRKRVKLVIELFKEAGKAISDMPLLLLEPLLVSFKISLFKNRNNETSMLLRPLPPSQSQSLFGSTSSSSLKVQDNFKHMNQERQWRFSMKNTWKSLGILLKSYISRSATSKTEQWKRLGGLISSPFFGSLNSCSDVRTLWLLVKINFLKDSLENYTIQFLIQLGAVSKWFFTRNKSKLGFPVVLSFGLLIRYHLGSVCFGSLVLAIMRLIRAILLFIEVKSTTYSSLKLRNILWFLC